MHIEIAVTDKTNADFICLVTLLDEDLHERYGEMQKNYDRHNTTDHILDAVVIYVDGEAAACGAFKEHSPDSVELKRIFVKKPFRGRGLSRLVVRELENLAQKAGYRSALLETGAKQFEAMHLYFTSGYTRMENFDPYVGDLNSLCMSKELS